MKKRILLAASLVLAAHGAQAVELVSNLLNFPDTSLGLRAPGAAAPFTVGSSSVTLGSVTLKVRANAHPVFGNSDGSVFYTAAIHADNAGSFGPLLSPINTVEDTTLVGTEDFTLPAASLITLNAGTTYWLFAQVGAGDSSSWEATDNGFETGLPGWTIGDQSAFLMFGPNPGVAPAMFSLNAAAVIPEPSTAVAAAGLAVGALALLRRRRRA